MKYSSKNIFVFWPRTKIFLHLSNLQTSTYFIEYRNYNGVAVEDSEEVTLHCSIRGYHSYME